MLDIFEGHKSLKNVFIKLCEESYLEKDTVLTDLGTSEKTFRNYVSRINKKNDSFEISIVKDLVILKTKDYYKVEKLYQKLKDDTSYELTKDEITILKSVLLNEYVALDELADILYVSKAYVYKLVEQLDDKLKDRNISIRGKTSKGIQIIGDELILRNLYVTTMKDSNVEYDAIVKEIQRLFNLSAEEVSLLNHLITVTILRRNHLSKHERDLIDSLMLNDSVAENYLIEIQSIIENYSSILIDKVEAQFIYLNVINRTSNKLSTHQNLKFSAEVKQLISVTLGNIRERYSIHIDESDFYNESKYHFLLLMNRLKLGIRLKQVLHLEHNQDYSFSHKLSLEFKNTLTHLYSLEINDAELDYIAIYIRLGLKKIFNIDDINKVVIVCHSGKGTALLLREKVKELFKLEHVTIDILTDLELGNVSEYDLIFSTVVLSQLNPNDYVFVENVLDDDYLKQSIGKLFSIHKGSSHQLLTLQDSIQVKDIYIVNDDSNYIDNLDKFLKMLKKEDKISATFMEKIKARENAGPTLFGKIGMPHAVTTNENFHIYFQVNQSKNSVYDLIFLLEIPERIHNENQVIAVYEEISKMSKDVQKIKILKSLKSVEEVSYFL